MVARGGTIYNAVDCFQPDEQRGAHVRNFRSSLFAGAVMALFSGSARAQPLNSPSPLAPPPAAISAAETSVWLGAAQRAHDLGLPGVAASLYREFANAGPAQRAAVALPLATALLDAGNAAEAEQVLRASPEPRPAAWRLRLGLAALQLRKRDAAQAEWNAIKQEELPPADLPWYYFLTGALYDTATPRDLQRANQFYTNAETGAPNELARARFQLAAERVRLHLYGRVSDIELRTARDNADRLGQDFAKSYAIMRAELGQVSGALADLNTALLKLPPQNRFWRDEFQFLIGLIGDRGRNSVGRNALFQLLGTGSSPLRQRQALQLLAEASTTGPERAQFVAEIRRLLEVKPPHPIADALLQYRAQLALADKDFVTAESHAERLVKDFPSSPLRVHALALLTQSSWDQGRYRLAAANAHRTRDALPAEASGPARAELGVLEAEASFRGGDFRTAADVYAAVIRERPAGLDAAKLGALMFQCVLAEIRAGSDEAAKRLDEFERDPAFDLESRWQAEWSLARDWQARGDIVPALERVTRLLDDAATAARLSPALRARMAWLQARLAFESERYPQALAFIDALLGSVESLDALLRSEITSSSVLLRARTQFALGSEAEAVETLKRLRANHAESDAAIRSYLIEADHHQAKGKIQDAQLALTKLIDTRAYEKSEYYPWALYRLALLSEQLGGEDRLKEANTRLEDLINPVGRNPAPADLVFLARLKQGDVFRQRNDNTGAQRAYEDAVNRFPQRPDVVIAQLRLAETHNALSSSDGPDRGHANLAQAKFEELLDRESAPADVRVEAGYNLGLLLERQAKVDAAITVWWRDVVNRFLPEGKAVFEAGAKRPYFLARTLFRMGELLEQQGRLGEAADAYRLILKAKLGHGEGMAKRALERLGVAP